MMKKSLLTSLVLCLSLFGTTRLGFAGQVNRETPKDPLSKMQAQGWKIVSDGVLQRERRAGEVETFVFGAEGFTWKLQDLQSQMDILRSEFQAHPTAEMRKAIVSHQKEIANTEKMIEVARVAEANGITGLQKDCTITYTYDASASYTNPQGTWASGNSSFSSTCGLSGEVYAYAYAQATVNGASTTQTVTDGPRTTPSGQSSVSAYAYASVYGGPSCQSYGYSSVTSSSLNPSSYSKSWSNYSCPDPIRVSVTSDWGTYVDIYGYDCESVTWTASASGGTPPYSYALYRNNVYQTSSNTYSEYFCGSNVTRTLYVTVSANVSDSGGQTASGSKQVTIRYHSNGGCYAATSADDPTKVVPICPQEPY